MALKRNISPEYSSQGAEAAGDAVAAGEPSRKKRKANANAAPLDDDSLFQSMAELLAKKLLEGGFLVGDLFEIKELLVTEIKKDLNEQAELRKGYGKMDDNEWVTLHTLRGCRLYCQALKTKRQALEEEAQAHKTKVQARKTKLQALEEEAQARKTKLQALKTKNQALKTKNQALEEEAQALKTKNQALKTKNQALEEEAQARKTKRQALEEELEKCSIERWIKLSKMGDEEAKKELDMELKRAPGATMTSHVNTHREEVTRMQEADFKLDEIPFLPRESKKGSRLMSRILLDFVQGQKGCAFTSERAIQDALDVMNTLLNHYIRSEDDSSIQLEIRTECSMFSNKPDHDVISADYQKYNILFPVEVKKDHEKVFTSKKVGGQVFDYIMLQKMLTGRPSFAVLTTFNQSKIVWDPGCNDVAETEGRFASDKVESTPATAGKRRQRRLQNTGSDPQTSKNCDRIAPEVVEDQREDSSRLLIYSKETYSPYKLLSVLCNVVIASLNKGLSKITIQTGNLLKGQTILVLKGKDQQNEETTREQLYEWRTQSVGVKVTGSWMDFNDTQKEYLVRSLVGVGSTSRCWGAVVMPDNETLGNGFSCVIKYWIKIWDENIYEYIAPEEIEEESKATTSQEVANYKKIYSDLFFKEGKGGCVGQQKLNNTYCVILPFFVPIGKDEREGEKLEQVLEEVRNVLSKNFYNKDEGKSYQFKKTDQRWRHIGRWTDSQGRKHLVLFDLADLEIKKATMLEHNEYIAHHIQTLRESLGPYE